MISAAGRARAIDIALLLTLKATLGAWVLSLGFTHVSDDDYARVVIAELFAHTPKIDPSGTSWLPFPFWMTGGAMVAFGRSLATARAVAFGAGLVSPALVYVALRALGVTRWVAVAGTALAMATPWNAWLGVATVPEALTGALVACGAMTASVPRARPWGAIALLVASLSRYESWAVCALFAATCVWSAARDTRGARGRDVACAVMALAGPLSWMAWNAHAHDGALHFLRRVAAYRETVASGAGTATSALITFPAALVTGAPEIVVVAGAGAVGCLDEDVRKRWATPLLSVVALLVFLVVGDWHGGAPTHHPERALVAAWWVLGAFGVDGLRTVAKRIAWARSGREAWVAAATAGAFVAWGATLRDRVSTAPGMGPEEQRDAQVLRGGELRRVEARTLDVVPCAYEHFAVLAAFGAPERATTEPATHETVTAGCPHIVIDEPDPH